MGRPRKYATDAERQRACRQRTKAEWVMVNRQAIEKLHEHLVRLQIAVGNAAAKGDPTARSCAAGSPDTVIEKLLAHFETIAEG